MSSNLQPVSNPPARIAVDAMGGDRGPQEVVRGVVDVAQREHIFILLVGKPDILEAELARSSTRPKNIEIVPASEVIEMGEQPTVAFKRKPDASVVVGARLVKQNKADALVTIGNTGAAMAVSLLTLGRIKGIDRPAIAAQLPTMAGGTVMLVDAGATVDCDPNNLYEFAIMGSVYAEHIVGVKRPRVGLLANGEEASKGNELVKRSHALFKQALTDDFPFEFCGNVESKEILQGAVDVVICDGFVGNIFLKTGEAVAEGVLGLIRTELTKKVWTRLVAAPLLPVLRGLRRRIDYSERGGAPLLGINGLCIIGHGRSNATAVANACRVAKRAVEHDIVGIIRRRICDAPSPPPAL